MTKRVQVEKQNVETKTEEAAVVEPKASENAQKLKDEIDELMDEIDSVLEINAEEFVKSYIQKGGE